MSLLAGTLKVLLVAQATGATLVGTVRDGETGEPLAGAVVSLPDVGRWATTDAAGRYLLSVVPPGPQHLTVELLGYARRGLHALVPREGELEIDVALLLAPIPLSPLEVFPPVPVRGLESADSTGFPDRGLSASAMRNHPLLAEPDAFQALAGGEVSQRPESPSGLHLRGGASDQTAYVLDGLPVLSPYHAAGVFSAWSPDAVAHLLVASAAPSPALPDALSGVVSGVTRTPGPRLGVQGSLSTSQLRVTVDGPLGAGGAGYLLSGRSGFRGMIRPKREASYLGGETRDWMAKLETPALGGLARLLAYDNDNELDAAASAAPADGRHGFAWHSRSLGAAWERASPGGSVRVHLWSALGEAGATWRSDDVIRMEAARRDHGLQVALTRSGGTSATTGGVRVERIRSSYGVASDPSGPLPWRLRARAAPLTLFVEHQRSIGRVAELSLATSVSSVADELRVGPRLQLGWTPSERVTLSASLARLQQAAQSLRNPESVVGNVFPADLYMGAGDSGVPVATSDQAVVGVDFRALAGARLGLQVHERRLRRLVLVAPGNGQPFAVSGFTVGSGRARGVSVDAALTGASYGVVATYAWQRVRLRYADSVYVPEHGTTHLAEAGVVIFPTATAQIRLSVVAGAGRRATALTGGLEWEACNVLDRGCELVGSPSHEGQPLGDVRLPAYVRLDLGLRKHWHWDVLGRDALIAAFGTVTNLFARTNVLTHARDPETGERVAVEMRPLAPLVLGLEWRF